MPLAAPEVVRKDPGVPRRAELWMNRLSNLYALSNYHPELQPTVECYQHVIQCWANADKEQPMVIVNRSERWLKEMLEQCREEDADVLLPIVTLSDNNVNNNHPESPQVPQRQQHPNHKPLTPTMACLNAFLDGCTRGRPGRNKKSQRMVTSNAKKAEAILRRLISYAHHYGDEATVQFNTDTCNFVIRGWTRCKHDETIHWRVLSILRLMESYQREDPLDSQVRPDTKSYSMAMDALIAVSKLKAEKYYKNLRQHQNHYRKRHDDADAPNENPSRNGMEEIDQAHAILQYMHELYDAGVEGVIPHRVPYNILITGWAGRAAFVSDASNENSGTPPFKAEEILRAMLSHRDDGFVSASPDVISYEKVMLAWANSGHPNAGKRATWWLKQLWREHDRRHQQQISASDEDIDLLPTVSTYNIAMKALARSEGALAAENLLLDLGERYQQDHTPGLCPNSESFAIVVRAWLQLADQTRNLDERIRSLKRAVEWLTSLREIENEKNLSTAPELYHGVIRVARSAASPDCPFILDIAKDLV
ncbi:MAG: hypothetical protein SGILL_006875 [Bacillariaceae sp.]